MSQEQAPHIRSGWTFDGFSDVYHFQHHPQQVCEELLLIADEEFWVVETIVPVAGKGEPDTWHLNRYYRWGLNDALSLAVTMQLGDHAEQVVSIRPATDEEFGAWHQAREALDEAGVDALADEALGAG